LSFVKKNRNRWSDRVRYERFTIWSIRRTGNQKHIWVGISFRELVGKENKQYLIYLCPH